MEKKIQRNRYQGPYIERHVCSGKKTKTEIGLEEFGRILQGRAAIDYSKLERSEIHNFRRIEQPCFQVL